MDFMYAVYLFSDLLLDKSRLLKILKKYFRIDKNQRYISRTTTFDGSRVDRNVVSLTHIKVDISKDFSLINVHLVPA